MRVSHIIYHIRTISLVVCEQSSLGLEEETNPKEGGGGHEKAAAEEDEGALGTATTTTPSLQPRRVCIKHVTGKCRVYIYIYFVAHCTEDHAHTPLYPNRVTAVVPRISSSAKRWWAAERSMYADSKMVMI